MMWQRIIWLFILFILGKHLGFPDSPRYLELADSADYFISRENWPRAEEKILEALRLEPANFSNSMLLSNLGMVQTRMGKYREALKSLSLGLNIAPSSCVLLNNRAHTFLLLDSVAPAVRDIDLSLKLDSVQEWPLQTRAFLYLYDNDTKSASLMLHQLKSLFPHNQSATAGFGAIAEKEGRTKDALKFYEQALKERPDDDETRESYILLLIRTDDYSGARKVIREGIEINEENPMFYLLRGYLHRLNHRLDEAKADKSIAIGKGLDPKVVTQFIP